jgi:hypothetical protein
VESAPKVLAKKTTRYVRHQVARMSDAISASDESINAIGRIIFLFI